MTRVCVVRHGAFGSDPRVTKEVTALARTPGVMVDVFARGPEPAPWGTVPGRRIRIHTLRPTAPSEHPLMLGLQALGFGVRVLAAILRARPRFDVVVVHSIPSWLVLLLWPAHALRPGTRILLDHHEPEAEMLREAGLPGPLAALYGVIERASVRRADGVVDVSDPMRDRSATLGARRQIVVDNAPAIHVPRASVDRPEHRHDLAVFGSLIHRYDLPTLARALAHADRSISIVQAGRGGASLDHNPTGGAWSSFDYLPPPSLQRELVRSRFGFVGLAPSTFTALVSPNRLWELSALEVPTIVARTALIEALLGPHAIYYEGGSWRSLVTALSRAMDLDQADRLAMGRGARERVRSRLWSEQSDAFVAFCLTGGQPRPFGAPNIPRPLKPVRRNAETDLSGSAPAARAALSADVER